MTLEPRGKGEERHGNGEADGQDRRQTPAPAGRSRKPWPLLGNNARGHRSIVPWGKARVNRPPIAFGRGPAYNVVMKRFLLLLAGLSLANGGRACPLPAGALESELAPRFQSWLDCVDAIAGSEEKKAFLSLGNDRDRDAFIAIFWQQRDPTPGTPENEYRDEIARRFAHVNQRFGAGGARPGWKTDMGRFYMILGEPRRIERFDEHPELLPVQVWYYSGDPALGLPGYFNLTFFRAHGAGDWKLYSPTMDGPAALLQRQRGIAGGDTGDIMELINRIAPTLSGPALGMVPGETAADDGSSLQSGLILSRILESPTRRIGTAYANGFLKYKSFVRMDASVRYVASSGRVALSWEPHSSAPLMLVSLKPKTISLAEDAQRTRFHARLRLSVSLRREEQIVHQYAKDFDLTVARDQVEALRRSGLVVHDVFPVIPGRFDVLAFLENLDSHEFCFMERGMDVPEQARAPRLGTPLIAFKSQPQPDANFCAFRLGGFQFSLDPEANFGTEDVPLLVASVSPLERALWEEGALELEVFGANDSEPFRRRRVPLRDFPFAQSLVMPITLGDMRLPAEYYRLRLRLVAEGGSVLATEETRFTMAPLARVAQPVELYKTFSFRFPAQFAAARASQYENVGRQDEAETLYAAALEREPAWAEVRLRYLRLLERMGKFAAVLEASEPLRAEKRNAFEFHFLRGSALYGLGRSGQALQELQAARRAYDSDIRVLNLIGRIHLERGEVAAALEAFTASLALDPRQTAVADAVTRLRAQKP